MRSAANVASARPAAPLRQQNRVLASLPQRERILIERYLDRVHVPPGTLLHRQDSPADDVYFPHQGLISVLATTAGGGTIEAACCGRSGVLCPTVASDLQGSLFTAVAQVTLDASRMPVAMLKTVLSQSPELGRAIEASRLGLLLQLRQNLVCAGLHPLEQRLARWLLEAADGMETNPIPATQEHVARRLGVRRTSVTYLARRLQDVGAIAWGRSRVDIVDPERLKHIACECYASLRARLSAMRPALGPPEV